jgi:hypothetical protein
VTFLVHTNVTVQWPRNVTVLTPWTVTVLNACQKPLNATACQNPAIFTPNSQFFDSFGQNRYRLNMQIPINYNNWRCKHKSTSFSIKHIIIKIKPRNIKCSWFLHINHKINQYIHQFMKIQQKKCNIDINFEFCFILTLNYENNKKNTIKYQITNHFHLKSTRNVMIRAIGSVTDRNLRRDAWELWKRRRFWCYEG